MTSDEPWLDEREQRFWRAWITLGHRLPARLHRELQADAGLSLPDFEVLVALTDTADHRVRVSDLAGSLGWERSRVSHHVTRMERRGLVRREECTEDGRGAFVVLADAGHRAIERAAPGHVRAVRRLVFDTLTPEELAAMEAGVARVLDRLGEDPAGPVTGPAADPCA